MLHRGIRGRTRVHHAIDARLERLRESAPLALDADHAVVRLIAKDRGAQQVVELRPQVRIGRREEAGVARWCVGIEAGFVRVFQDAEQPLGVLVLTALQRVEHLIEHRALVLEERGANHVVQTRERGVGFDRGVLGHARHRVRRGAGGTERA